MSRKSMSGPAVWQPSTLSITPLPLCLFSAPLGKMYPICFLRFFSRWRCHWPRQSQTRIPIFWTTTRSCQASPDKSCSWSPSLVRKLSRDEFLPSVCWVCSLFCILEDKSLKELVLMVGFELQISGLGSDPCTNCSTTNGAPSRMIACCLFDHSK